MKISQKYSLVNDLEESLNTIFENTEQTFYFSNEQISTNDVFQNQMFLPLFLFDKQSLIYRFCKEQLGHDYFVQVILQQNPEAFFSYLIHIEHNLKSYEQYKYVLKFLISLVMADPCITQDKVQLSHKYDMMKTL